MEKDFPSFNDFYCRWLILWTATTSPAFIQKVSVVIRYPLSKLRRETKQQKIIFKRTTLKMLTKTPNFPISSTHLNLEQPVQLEHAYDMTEASPNLRQKKQDYLILLQVRMQQQNGSTSLALWHSQDSCTALVIWGSSTESSLWCL